MVRHDNTTKPEGGKDASDLDGRKAAARAWRDRRIGYRGGAERDRYNSMQQQCRHACAASGERHDATLALLETTDIHTNLLSYDYYKLAEDKSLGLERTATLIAAARKEFPTPC